MNNKDAYVDALKSVWKDRNDMVDYVVKNTYDVVVLDNGGLFPIDKPSIETYFCFGYGYCGMSDYKSERSAFNSANDARTKPDYFLEYNLSGLNSVLDTLVAGLNKGVDLYVWANAHGVSPITGDSIYKEDDLLRSSIDSGKCYKLSRDDMKRLYSAYLDAKERFTKRLNAYLKKYGTSKLHVWTYLRD